MSNPTEKKLNVVMLPFIAHGHIFPFLELAKKLVSCQRCNVDIHFISTPINLKQIKVNLASNSNFLGRKIKLLELHLPVLPELPSHLHSTKYIHPDLLPRLTRAFDRSSPAFEKILETLKPDILIYDILETWAPLAAKRLGIPSVLFCITGATSAAFFHHFYVSPDKLFPFPSINVTLNDLSRPVMSAFNEEDESGLTPREEWGVTINSSSSFIVTRSFREIEAKYIDYLSLILKKEVAVVGPLLPDFSNDPLVDEQEHERIMGWLERRERRSVVYVSFGSEYFMTNKEMEQLALGLEKSGASFIWVVRLPKQRTEKTVKAHDPDIYATELPNVPPEKGIVVDGWAPQLKILEHPNLGAFLTHCGRSSMLEGMRVGVPMIALPMQVDQPLNAKLIVELGIGLEIPQQGLGNFKAEDVATCITQVLKSDHSERIRGKVDDLAREMSSRNYDSDIELLAEKMMALCNSRDQDVDSSMNKD
ncbi:Glycosyltransferase [Rhynchospora pubera]|uniref:Glycosyltransferase n=1 Tax=Rhynchospora pubera TaxID=906938 RepID=A0AAV8FWT9_9POAL|nr:Glycosyltransferase [Rhynchospora pubera]KAJ4797384.1 Glycosyltransferase [Rhynchospora pubera]